MQVWIRLVSLCVGIALLFLVIGAWLSGPRVNSQSYQLIQVDMTEGEVEKVLGPGADCPAAIQWPEQKGLLAKQYSGEGYSIVVWYDDLGRVSSKTQINWLYRWEGEPLRFALRRWIGLTP